ncbi:MAG: NADH-quinone oxidoreductase subunit L [Reichenbachiella sp.]
MDNQLIILSILILPLIGGVIAYSFKKWSGLIHVGSSGLTFILVIISISSIDQLGIETDWFNVGNISFDVGLWYDGLSGIMTLIVSIIALMVAVFSIEYMKHDGNQPKYYAFLGLFAFSMYGIVLSSNLLLTFVFWELVGFSSYLLIGFWYQKEAPPKSSFKAFIMNKVGDAGFLLGIFAAFICFRTLNIQNIIWEVNEVGLDGIGVAPLMIFLLGFGLFLAAMGKSAQFPLQTWLPDAMTGPTPVSALIHAATMVAAGVYLLVRVFPLLSPEVLQFVLVVGGITTFSGAFAAFGQNDIKKILAYSTVSQLGYMVMAIGAGVPLAAFFHLTTHAIFKAGLFLCAGSIVHYFHETNSDANFDGQDLRNMGGLRKALPYTFATFTVFMLALAGLPLFSGFLSKELILIGLVSNKEVPFFVVVFGFASVFMTAAYMSRLYFQVFFGEKERKYFQESFYVKGVVILLAVLSFWFVFSINPMDPSASWLTKSLQPIVGYVEMGHYTMIPIISISLALFGMFIAYLYVDRHLMETQIEIVKKIFYRLSRHNFYLDQFYKSIFSKAILILANITYFVDKNVIDRLINVIAKSEVIISHVIGWVDRSIIDGLVSSVARIAMFTGSRTRSIQGGNVQVYFVWALIGLLSIFYFLN